ncbi:MAG: YkgJ family cysteine cluster protein [Spirochaetes bacterium]|jgi:Fe-S-cluster containining protein|nr:YkgJ family cysteine cluster protein [Spirochaetota bacterium]
MGKEKNNPSKPLLEIPPSAEIIHAEIVGILRQILNSAYSDCCCEDFRGLYSKAMKLYDDYQRISVEASGDKMPCGPGCWICCCHYAEDIYSFEAEIISLYVKQLSPQIRTEIERRCENAVYELERIKTIVLEKLSLEEYRPISDETDPDEILLNSYYQLRNRCPFLDESGRCIIYHIRPLTCRAYINLGDPSVCPPEMIHETDTATYILDLDDEANDILDQLHFRFERYPEDTALCSLVLKYLSEDELPG